MVAGVAGVILLGTLASLAIHGVRRHLGAAMTAEAAVILHIENEHE